MIGLVAVSVIMFYRYLIWQLEFSSVLPLISSSQRFSFSRLKQKILNGRYVNDGRFSYVADFVNFYCPFVVS